MSEAVDAIRQLIAEIQAGLQPQTTGATSRKRSDRDD